MTSGTLSVFAYLRFVQMRRRHSIVGEPSEEHRDGKAGKTGGRQPDLVAEPLGSQLQRHQMSSGTSRVTSVMNHSRKAL